MAAACRWSVPRWPAAGSPARVRVYCSADSGAADSGAADSGAVNSGAVNSGAVKQRRSKQRRSKQRPRAGECVSWPGRGGRRRGADRRVQSSSVRLCRGKRCFFREINGQRFENDEAVSGINLLTGSLPRWRWAALTGCIPGMSRFCARRGPGAGCFGADVSAGYSAGRQGCPGAFVAGAQNEPA